MGVSLTGKRREIISSKKSLTFELSIGPSGSPWLKVHAMDTSDRRTSSVLIEFNGTDPLHELREVLDQASLELEELKVKWRRIQEP